MVPQQAALPAVVLAHLGVDVKLEALLFEFLGDIDIDGARLERNRVTRKWTESCSYRSCR